MKSPNQNGLRLRNNQSTGKKYDIEVRTRPVMGYASFLATHAFIVLVEGDRVVDSLSFDPSNSIGLEDKRPYDYSRGKVVIGTNVKTSTWTELKEAFQRAAINTYSLQYNNCTHAVVNALISGPLLPGSHAGATLARDANSTWDFIHGRLSATDDSKKNR